MRRARAGHLFLTTPHPCLFLPPSPNNVENLLAVSKNVAHLPTGMTCRVTLGDSGSLLIMSLACRSTTPPPPCWVKPIRQQSYLLYKWRSQRFATKTLPLLVTVSGSSKGPPVGPSSGRRGDGCPTQVPFPIPSLGIHSYTP